MKSLLLTHGVGAAIGFGPGVQGGIVVSGLMVTEALVTPVIAPPFGAWIGWSTAKDKSKLGKFKEALKFGTVFGIGAIAKSPIQIMAAPVAGACVAAMGVWGGMVLAHMAAPQK